MGPDYIQQTIDEYMQDQLSIITDTEKILLKIRDKSGETKRLFIDQSNVGLLVKFLQDKFYVVTS